MTRRLNLSKSLNRARKYGTIVEIILGRICRAMGVEGSDWPCTNRALHFCCLALLPRRTPAGLPKRFSALK